MTRDTLQRFTKAVLLVFVALAIGNGCREDPSANTVSIGSSRSAGLVGQTGTVFDLTAKAGSISTPDGGSIPTWGYAFGDGPMQYPGPSLIVNQGQEITVNLSNELSVPVSILFPGQRVTATFGVDGALAREALPGQSVTYTFQATKPGTFTYYSGTQPELQVEMGLVGALVVRPNLGPGYAYNHPSSAFDTEFLFLLTEMDPVIHQLAAAGDFDAIDFSARWPVYWFLNGRAAPDTMLPDAVGWLPNQPYSCMPHMHPGERLLMRVINAGSDLHPFHHHGNHARVIATNGQLLESAPGAGPDLSHEVFTIQAVPGETVDAIFQWTGQELGWDIYGDPSDYPHACNDGNSDNFDDITSEYCPDHGKPIPVTLPHQQQLTFGGFYSGSPYLGVPGLLPPGEGGNNPGAAFQFMWHSHTEREMTNNDIFPGGMMTMLMIESPSMTMSGSNMAMSASGTAASSSSPATSHSGTAMSH
jgi:FtsP/CotA-like multicopper oxidase with cupredoxin domain